MEEQALVRDRDEVALVVRCALLQVIEVTCDVDAAHEVGRVREVVDELRADASHADHVQDDGAAVCKLDARGPLLQHAIRAAT